MSNILIPSYAGGFARNAAEARYPELWPGLVGAWQMFLGPTGPKLLDWSGYHSEGAPPDAASTPSWVTTQMGHALDFDGTDDWVNCGTKNSFDVDDQLTVCIRVKVHSWQPHSCFVIRDPSWDGAATYAWILYDLFRFYVTTLSGVSYTGTFPGYADNMWHHVCAVYNRNLPSQRLKVYIDGNLESTVDGYNEQVIPQNYKLAIGCDFETPPGNDTINAEISSVILYNRALSLQEIAFLYVNPYALAELREERLFRSVAYTVPLGYILHTMEAA